MKFSVYWCTRRGIYSRWFNTYLTWVSIRGENTTTKKQIENVNIKAYIRVISSGNTKSWAKIIKPATEAKWLSIYTVRKKAKPEYTKNFTSLFINFRTFCGIRFRANLKLNLVQLFSAPWWLKSTDFIWFNLLACSWDFVGSVLLV